MIPIDFPDSNRTFTAPTNWNRNKPCLDLHVLDDDGTLTSCWRPTWRERFRILFGKPIWLAIVATRQPPVSLDV